MLQYASKHGLISRGEAAELCRINPLQAYRLLTRLERRGRIERVAGSTKATRYGAASNSSGLIRVFPKSKNGVS